MQIRHGKIPRHLSDKSPMPKSGLTAARQPSAESLHHRNCPAVDQTLRPTVDQKYLEKADSLSCYVRSSESLRLVSKSPRQRLCTMKEAFRVSKTRIIQVRASLDLSIDLWATWRNMTMRDTEIGEMPRELRSKGRVIIHLNSVDSEGRCCPTSCRNPIAVFVLL